MLDRWKGDGEFMLPAGSVEPYRLWFEYLKLASTDPEVTINPTVYAEWGDYHDQTFSKWWKDHWRSHFAVRNRVELLNAGTLVPTGLDTITLNIPLSGHSDDVLAQVAAFLDREGVNLKGQGRFALSLGYEHGFLKQLDKARRYLRLYSYWLRHSDTTSRKRIERAAKDYVRWYEGWEAKIKAGSRRRVTPIPYFYKVFVAYLDSGGRKSGISQVMSAEGNVENARRQIVRDVRIARKLAENVAGGVFPGVY